MTQGTNRLDSGGNLYHDPDLSSKIKSPECF